MIRHPDVASGLCALVAGLALILISLDIDVAPSQATLNARFFPILAASFIALCGLGILARGLIVPRAEIPIWVNFRLAATATLFVAYFLSFEYVDFRVGAWVLTLACMVVLGARSRVQLAVTPAVVAVSIYGIFRYGFEVILPTWT